MIIIGQLAVLLFTYSYIDAGSSVAFCRICVSVRVPLAFQVISMKKQIIKLITIHMEFHMSLQKDLEAINNAVHWSGCDLLYFHDIPFLKENNNKSFKVTWRGTHQFKAIQSSFACLVNKYFRNFTSSVMSSAHSTSSLSFLEDDDLSPFHFISCLISSVSRLC